MVRQTLSYLHNSLLLLAANIRSEFCRCNFPVTAFQKCHVFMEMWSLKPTWEKCSPSSGITSTKLYILGLPTTDLARGIVSITAAMSSNSQFSTSAASWFDTSASWCLSISPVQKWICKTSYPVPESENTLYWKMHLKKCAILSKVTHVQFYFYWCICISKHCHQCVRSFRQMKITNA